MKAFQIFEERGVPLQDSYRRIDQIREEDGESKQYENGPRDVDECESYEKDGRGQQDVYRAAIEHLWWSILSRVNRSGLRVSV